jgi:uncharacterized protein DUF29
VSHPAFKPPDYRARQESSRSLLPVGRNDISTPKSKRGLHQFALPRKAAEPTQVPLAVGIDADYHEWLAQQAQALRQKDTALLNWDKVAEELDAMAASERRELKNRLIQLIAHLLKWLWASEQRASHENSWRKTIREQRRQLNDLLADSPSLRSRPQSLLTAIYTDARQDAVDDTGLQEFPTDCPWSIDQILSPDFWP